MVDVPTIDDFKARFSGFSGVPDPRIQLFIDEASRSVDDSWIAADQKTAILYLAAHLMESDDRAGAGTGEIASESFGPISLSYVRRDGSSDGDYSSTQYGSRFAELLANNRSGPVVI